MINTFKTLVKNLVILGKLGQHLLLDDVNRRARHLIKNDKNLFQGAVSRLILIKAYKT